MYMVDGIRYLPVLANKSNRDLSLKALAVDAGDIWGM
jgi:hypothetical protein